MISTAMLSSASSSQRGSSRPRREDKLTKTSTRRRKRRLSDSGENSDRIEISQPPGKDEGKGAKRHRLRTEAGPGEEDPAPSEDGSQLTHPDVTPPPSGYDLDRLRYHIDLQDFGKSLQNAANAVFSNDRRSKYHQTSVLMLSWADEDPDLPVSLEICALRDVFVNLYSFGVEEWQIPAIDSHMELNLKILQFLKDSSPKHLKIVYYAGHGRLSNHGQVLWTRYVPSRHHWAPS